MEKYGRARQTTGDSVTQCVCFACWSSKGIDTSLVYVILTAFPQHHWLCDMPQCCIYMYIACLI